MKSCLLCGVGGQGTVLASRIIAEAAMNKGLFTRTAETIGMAQRGGSVVSHVRMGQSVPSPMIPFGQADVIIGFEPGEAVRNLKYLKPDGLVIVSDREVQPVTAALSGVSYSGQEMIAWLREHCSRLIVLQAREICEACGSERVMNVALIGALAESGEIELTTADMEHAVEKRVKPRFIELNKKALALGAGFAGRTSA